MCAGSQLVDEGAGPLQAADRVSVTIAAESRRKPTVFVRLGDLERHRRSAWRYRTSLSDRRKIQLEEPIKQLGESKCR